MSRVKHDIMTLECEGDFTQFFFLLFCMFEVSMTSAFCKMVSPTKIETFREYHTVRGKIYHW
ncbi:unnamed protein product, partial [Ceratitis capitata]